MITVVNVRSAPSDSIYVARRMPGYAGSPLGNPYHLKIGESRGSTLAKYRKWLWDQMQSETEAMLELRRLAGLAKKQDITLACWCAPKPCHGNIIKAAIEYLMETENL